MITKLDARSSDDSCECCGDATHASESDDNEWCARCRTLLASVINYEGDGSHPMADDDTLAFFTGRYVRECVEKACMRARAKLALLEKLERAVADYER